MDGHVQQQAVADEGGEQHEADLPTGVAIIELLLVLCPVDAAHLHRLVQMRKNYLRRGLGGQVYRVHADQRALR